MASPELLRPLNTKDFTFDAVFNASRVINPGESQCGFYFRRAANFTRDSAYKGDKHKFVIGSSERSAPRNNQHNSDVNNARKTGKAKLKQYLISSFAEDYSGRMFAILNCKNNATLLRFHEQTSQLLFESYIFA